MTLDLDDLERRAEAAIADTRGQVCWHDARTALALIQHVRQLEAVVDAAVAVADLDELCLQHVGIDDPIGISAEEALALAVAHRRFAVDAYRARRKQGDSGGNDRSSAPGCRAK